MVKTTTTYSRRHRLKNREGPSSDAQSQLGGAGFSGFHADHASPGFELEDRIRVPASISLASSHLAGSTEPALRFNLPNPKPDLRARNARNDTDDPNHTKDADSNQGSPSRASGSPAVEPLAAKKRKRSADARPDPSTSVDVVNSDGNLHPPGSNAGHGSQPRQKPGTSNSKSTKKRKYSAESHPTSTQSGRDLHQAAGSPNPEPSTELKPKRIAAPGPSQVLASAPDLDLNHTSPHSVEREFAPSPPVVQPSRVLAAGSVNPEPTNNAKRKRSTETTPAPAPGIDGVLPHSKASQNSKPEPESGPNSKPKPKLKPRPRKKQKRSQEEASTSTGMALQPFQTPFPTLQAQSQVFRLPSSKPLPSPEEAAHQVLVASPAIVGVAQQKERQKTKTKTKVQKENQTQNQNQSQTRRSGNTTARTSETLKSTRTHGDLSKTLTSLTLTSEGFAFPSHSRSHSRPTSRLSRRHHTTTEQGSGSRSRPGSRSASCSSRSSASAASHHQQQKAKSKARSNFRPVPRLKHTQSLTSLHPRSHNENDLDNDMVNVKNPKKNRKSNKGKAKKTTFPSSRTLSSGPISDEHVLSGLLASPFVSRASSPVDGGSASKVKAQVQYGREGVIVNRADIELMGPPPVPGMDVDAEPRKRASSGGSGLRTALKDLEYNPNLPRPIPGSGAAGANGKSQSAHTSPQKSLQPEKSLKSERIDFTKLGPALTKSQSKSKAKAKSRMSLHPDFSSRAENRVYGTESGPGAGKKQSEGMLLFSMGERERRPSAPSWLHPPKMKKRISDFGPRVGGDRDVNEGGGEERQNLRLSSGLHIVLDAKARAAGAMEAPTTTEPSSRKPKKPKLALEVNQNPDRDLGAEDSDPMDWMHSRRDVDFNRPPSRMSIGGSGFGCDDGYEFGFGFEDGFEYGDVEGWGDDDDVFFDSSSASENEDGAGEDNDEAEIESAAKKRRISPLDLNWDWDANLRAGMSVDEKFEALFGKDVVKASTPAKTKMAVEVGMGAVGASGHLAGRASIKGAPNPAALDGQTEDDEDRDGEADMDLTADAASAAIKVSSPAAPAAAPPLQLQLQLHEGRRRSGTQKQKASAGRVDQLEMNGVSDSLDADFTPWVTDSLISPPTVYLAKLKGKDGRSAGDDVDNAHRRVSRHRAPVPEPQPGLGPGPMRLSSPFRPSEGAAGSASPAMGVNTSLKGLSETEPPDDLEQTPGHYQSEESTSESSDTARPPHAAPYQSHTQSKGVDEQRLAAANAKRTRSGTIVPLAPPLGPPGARRTRGGTIIGPLPPAPAPEKPLPAVPDSAPARGLLPSLAAEPRRTRSGTIVPSSSLAAGHGAGGPGMGLGRRTRSGSVLQVKNKGVHAHSINLPTEHGLEHIAPHGFDPDPQAAQDADADGALDVVDCYIDSVYLPPLMSSPDPIDFLRFASIEEEEDVDEEEGRSHSGLGSKDLNWRVAEDPPSPEVTRNEDKAKEASRGGGGLFRGGRFRNLGRKLGGLAGGGDTKGKGKKKARFLGREEAEESDAALHGLADEEMSDDELLLLPGQTAGLWV